MITYLYLITELYKLPIVNHRNLQTNIRKKIKDSGNSTFKY
ncbi:hypothetical protein CCPUN_09180 [Cardinium endosymbiont of Culicoides punctatus]|nr:hypothetical protein CCPUN_09180 [Cardinium endosymbiont of Culicoides punctatus]